MAYADPGEIAGWLRGRAKMLAGYDKIMLHRAADALEADERALSADAVAHWLEGEGVALLPWQKKKLGLE